MTGMVVHDGNNEPIKAEIVLYQSDGANVPVQVRYMDETLWLTQAQMAEIFGVKVPNISKHLGNIYEEGELERGATISKMETVRNEGGRMVRRKQPPIVLRKRPRAVAAARGQVRDRRSPHG